jgi:hypothetical protein
MCNCDKFVKDDPALKARKKTTARKVGTAKGVNEL